MRRFVEEADRGQWTLLPECLDDFIDESNPVRVIDVFVEALDLAEMNVEASTELKRCVLDRIGPPNRQARPLPPQAALRASLESRQPARNMLRRHARSPAMAPTSDRGQHSSERDIG